MRNKQESIQSRFSEIRNKGADCKGRIDEANQELAEFDTQEGQQLNNLALKSQHTAKAWKWVQEHLEEFEQEVYGPPMISCSMKDPKYAMVVESLLARNDFLVITAQNTNDSKKLQDQIYGKMGLVDVIIRSAEDILQ